MLSIGEFSRICFVSRKTLRHYDEIGLLRPEYVAENGYRYYSTKQLRSMLLISRLKGYGFSLPEIAAVLANPEEEALAERISEKRRQLAAELESKKRVLAQMDRDVDHLKRRIDIMENSILVKTAEREPLKVYGIRRRIDIDDFSDLFGQLFMDVAQKGLHPTGPPMVFYHEEDFNPQSTDVEVGIPVSDDLEGVRTLDGGLCCFTTLVGAYGPELFTPAYAALGKWVLDNGYHINGAPFDVYVRGGKDCPPEEYVTEVYFPIAK